MNSNRLITLAVAAAIVTGIGFWYARTGAPPDTRAADSGPVALVKTAVLQHSRIEETLKAYGTVDDADGRPDVLQELHFCTFERGFGPDR